MKKLISTILFLSIVMCLFSCGKETYSKDDIALYDTETRQLLRLGDSREQIEKIIGKAKESEKTYGLDNELLHDICEYDDNLNIWYDENNNAEHITVYYSYMRDSNRYELPRKIGFNSTVTDFCDAYPGNLELEKSTALLLKKNKNKYAVCNADEYNEAVEKFDNSGKYAYMSVDYSDYSSIDWIEISSCINLVE